MRKAISRTRGAARRLTPIPLHWNEPIDPFFIVGSGRCGTTLLRRLLQASPKVHIPPENWALGSCIVAFRRYRWLLSWLDMVDLLLSRIMYSNPPRWFDAPPSDLRRHLIKMDSNQKSLACLLDEVYRHHGRLQDATFERWGDKTPINVSWMDEILSVFPRAKFIHLLRDGVDVTHSMSKMQQYSGDVSRPARRWKNAVSEARTFGESHPDHFLEVRYEHLVRQPEETMQHICRHIDLAYDSAILNRTDHYDEMQKAQSVPHLENVFEPISTASIGKGRRNLEAMQKRQLASLIGDDLPRLGYEPVQI